MSSEQEEQERIEFVDRRSARMAADDAAAGVESAAPGAASDADAASLQAELASLREQSETHYRNWQRSAADFINFKRRVEQDRAESARLANAAVVINLTPVFDALDRAVGTVDAPPAGLNWVQGVVAIHRKFSQMLEAMGVREIEASGHAFDPARHEAIGQQAGEEGKVIHVVKKGYLLGDKVLRPAMVIVGGG